MQLWLGADVRDCPVPPLGWFRTEDAVPPGMHRVAGTTAAPSRMWEPWDPDPAVAPRPALALVQGTCRMTGEGWIAHHGVLDPVQLRAAHRDLAADPWWAAGSTERRRIVHDRVGRLTDEDCDYLSHYLDALLAFTGELSDRRMAMICMIG